MRFSTILATTFSIATLVSSNPITPNSEKFGLQLKEREELNDLYHYQEERDLLSTAESLLSSINLTSILGSIDFEQIAGWANNLLTEDDNVKYLDYILEFVGTTNLVPVAISFILSNNETRGLAGDAVVGLIGSGQFDLTPVFEALKDSGLAYTLIADLIENPNTLPFVIQVIKDTLGGTSIGNIVGGIVGSGSTTVQVSGVNGNTAAFTLATGSLAYNSASAGTAPALVSSIINSANANGGVSVGTGTGAAVTGTGAANGGANTVFGQTLGTDQINTGSIAALISAAAAQESGNTQLTLAAATNTQIAATTTRAAVTTAAQAPATTQAAGVVGAGGVTSYDLATIRGPAFQSLPPSQFGIGATTINYSALAQVTAALGGGSKKREDAVEEVLQMMKQKRQEEDEVEMALQKMKRDNIEDLLTTIFSSVARSGLINETIQYLVTDDQFEGAVVQILQGVFANIGSTLTGLYSTDWSTIYPLVNALLNSGLLTDIITKAFNDEDLKNALYRDLQQIFKRDLELTDLQMRDLQIIARDQFNSSVSISTITQGVKTNSSSVVTVNGAVPNSNKYAPMALAAIGLSALIL
ncbi:hypothetical protein KGF54_004873 [Candida jiufengensis]|uniref:uncharacterized protein n=1 Tax=Candida jiufengensis TaxID=497108 RepID=UPI002224C061|nr:uncharacterized protein KGF54_004873 [Candida jiufengensis]KAI5951798.1 hypothetical protein KGF54_004873 [Candida jiufengensis]